jgi:hypothetical protein
MAASASLLLDDDPDICASQSDIISELGYRLGVAFIRQILSKLPDSAHQEGRRDAPMLRRDTGTDALLLSSEEVPCQRSTR